MAFFALASFGRKVPTVLPAHSRHFCSAVTASIWNRASSSACSSPSGNHLPALAEQLIDLRRRVSTISAWDSRHLATPVEVGLTPPSAASAESSTGVPSGPSGKSAEVSTGLGDPQSVPSGEEKFGQGTIETPSAERTIDPAGGQSPVGDKAADIDAPPTAEPSASSSSADPTPAGTSDTSSTSGLTGGPLPDPDKGSSKDEPATVVQANQQTIFDDFMDVLRYQQSRMWLRSIVFACDPSFKESEFLESAKDAYWMVMNIFSTKGLDTELLAQMLSKPMLSAMKSAHGDAEAKGLASRLLQHDIDSAAIVKLQILDRDLMAEVDPDIAAPAPSGETSESQSFQASLNPYRAAWMVISVKFTGLLKTELFNISDGKAQTIIEDRRSHTWRFARGPLPDKLPEQNLTVPWVVLDLVD